MPSTISAAIEDYLEAILLMSGEDGSVRVTDIADKLGIAKPSVTAAVNVLKDKGLVTQKRYGRVYLTPEGMAEAQRVKEKHKVLKAFLVEVLGVGEEAAERDACAMEHVVSAETMGKLIAFLKETLPKH